MSKGERWIVEGLFKGDPYKHTFSSWDSHDPERDARALFAVLDATQGEPFNNLTLYMQTVEYGERTEVERGYHHYEHEVWNNSKLVEAFEKATRDVDEGRVQIRTRRERPEECWDEKEEE